MKQEIGIYIHIPFCISKCYYCNFVSYANRDDIIKNYIDAVCLEILQNAEILSEYTISTIYFGGGTPSYIDAKYIKKIMDTLNLFREKNDFLEVTIEVNPNSITLEKLIMYKSSGINRISIGVQSTHDDILKAIGRKHRLEDVKNTLENCKEAGFTNISLDLIYPLPNLTLEKFSDTIDYIISIKGKYNIKHISVYNLEIHEGGKLDFLLNEGYLELADEDIEYKMKELLEEKLEKNSFNKYEISNFSIAGFESKHNISYWNQKMYLGFGVCASSFFSNTRYKNTDDIDRYINNINSNVSPIESRESLDLLDLMKEYIILKLRLTKGFFTSEFRKFGKDVFDIFGDELKDLNKKGLIKIEKYDKKMINDKDCYNISLTKRGSEVANIVWEKFI